MKTIFLIIALAFTLTACLRRAPQFDTCPDSFTAAVAKYGEPVVQKSYDTRRADDGKAFFTLKRTVGTWTLANGVLIASFDHAGSLTEHSFYAKHVGTVPHS